MKQTESKNKKKQRTITPPKRNKTKKTSINQNNKSILPQQTNKQTKINKIKTKVKNKK